MDIWTLPTSLDVGGESWEIRTDYRAIIDILIAFNNPEYEADERWIIALTIAYKDFKNMHPKLYAEACLKLSQFIDMGTEHNDNQRVKPKVMDWEQDAQLIIPAVNRVLNKEVRAVEYMHWWTFLAAYMEIGECSYTQILNIRSKKAKGKKLEKWEQEYIAENKDTVLLKAKLTDEEIAEERRLEELFG